MNKQVVVFFKNLTLYSALYLTALYLTVDLLKGIKIKGHSWTPTHLTDR